LLVVVLILAAGRAGAAAKNPGTIVYASYADSAGFDPDWEQDMSPLFNVYEPLLAFRGAGVGARDLEPRLSASVPTRENGLISADGLTYRFPIRKGVKFSDGSPLTPEDVRYSLLRFMLMDRSGGPSAFLLEPILGVTTTRPGGRVLEGLGARAFSAVTVDGDSVVVRLRAPFAPFLSVLTNYGRVVSKAWCAAHGQWDGGAATWARFNDPDRASALPDDAADGTGPFRLERYDRDTREIVLARNEHYWRALAKLRRVVIKSVPEFLTRKLMLQAGDADVIAVSPLNAPQLAGLDGVRLTGGLRKIQLGTLLAFNAAVSTSANPNLGSGVLGENGVPPDFFADKDVREGFARSIDADSYLRDILRGAAEPSSGLIPPGLVGYRKDPSRYPFDLQAAEASFRRARGGEVWEKGFRAALVYATGREDNDVLCRMIKKNVESLNPRFHVDVRGLLGAAALEQTYARKAPLFLTSWTADYPDSHNFAFALLHSNGSLALQGGMTSRRADALIEEAAGTLDEKKRAELYGKLRDIVDEELPYAPIGDMTHFRAERTWVKGFVFNPAAHGLPYDSDYYQLDKVAD
jgi:peptide/nickel transport system substrate-binding protein